MKKKKKRKTFLNEKENGRKKMRKIIIKTK